MKTAYKFLRTGMKSDYDGSVWKLGKWRSVAAPTEPCVGLNASKNIVDALGYIQGEILAKVEYKGGVIDSGDKLTCEHIRILQTWKWTKKHSVCVTVFAARLALPIFERRFPQDNRPRLATEAAEKCLEAPSKENTIFARDAAEAARAARSAAWDAWDAAHAAWAATRGARAAAGAVYAARAAAEAADIVYAAGATAAAADIVRAARAVYAVYGNKIKNKAHRYVLRMLKEDRR